MAQSFWVFCWLTHSVFKIIWPFYSISLQHSKECWLMPQDAWHWQRLSKKPSLMRFYQEDQSGQSKERLNSQGLIWNTEITLILFLMIFHSRCNQKRRLVSWVELDLVRVLFAFRSVVLLRFVEVWSLLMVKIFPSSTWTTWEVELQSFLKILFSSKELWDTIWTQLTRSIKPISKKFTKKLEWISI